MDKQFPKVVVGCFILNDKDEVLLVRSYKWAGKWVVMGGHVEWGETIAEAAVREVKEEIGLKVEFKRVIEVVEFVFDPGFHDKRHMIALQSECHVLGDTALVIDNDEIQEAKYFSLNDAVKLDDILDVTKKTIQKIISARHG